MTLEQMHAIGELSAFYGRYPGLKTSWTQHEPGMIGFRASYLVPADTSDTEGTHPESQFHWIDVDGALDV